ncbi:uncharacterized protein LOC124164545 isoform X2 [Ischnura elegans]|uniref:uncharacterized protein LOC124164545 isoform X2 n=1 Tax=Ischnura elegans TaxID=197161 RepID=UPI001ED8A9CA|nr:uncharacterized protein LOC124164545 isoform X2 [Ischnura elegans]
MPSRSPSRRSSPLSPRSRASSQRSPSFGIHGTSRRGRSSPTDDRRRRVIPRGANSRSSVGSSRGRGSEVRHPPGSISSGSYTQGQYARIPHSSSQLSPRKGAPAATKRHSYSPPMSVVASVSGLKRKYVPIPCSSSSSSSSPPRPQHHHLQFLKKKRLAVQRVASSREPPIPLRKRSRSKSPIRDKLHRSHSSSHYNVRDDDGRYDEGPVTKGSSYSAGRTSALGAVSSRNYSTSPRRHEIPPKRYIGEPVVRYAGGVSDIGDSRPVYRSPDKTESAGYSDRELKQFKVKIRQKPSVGESRINRQIVDPEDIVMVRRPGVSEVGDSRPVYRGPEKTESGSYSDRELKQIKIGIHQKLSVDESRINRQIVNPEDIVVVRRPDGSLAAIGVQDDMYKMVSIRNDSGEIVEALCKLPTGKMDLKESLQNASLNGCEGSRPIFEREELREADGGDGKYAERERSRQEYRLGGEDRQRVMERHLHPVEERVVAIVDDDGPTTMAASSSHHAQSHRSRSLLPSSSRTGDARLESISPNPFPSVERQGRRDNARSYSNLSPSPPPRIASSYSGGRSRDYEQAGTSRTLPSMSSQSRHKEGASSDLRLRINEKHTSEHRNLSHYHRGEGTPIIHSKIVSQRGYVEHQHAEGHQEYRQRGFERGDGHSAVVPSQHAMESEDYQSRSGFRNKSSSSSIPSWDGNPEYVPKGRAYYEHDNRDEEWVRMGASGGPRRSRGGRFAGGIGGRGRAFRGGYHPRGRGRGRGNPRGYFGGPGRPNRGYVRGGGIRRAVARGAAGMGGSSSYSRGKATSPSLWKHDMFENLSSDENRPTSTSEAKL